MAVRVPPFTLRAAIFAQLVSVVSKIAGVQPQVTSWYRTPDENAAVGGKPNSLHLVGEAIDLVFGSSVEAARVQNIWRTIGLDAVDEADHLHLELDGPLLR